MNFTLCSPSQTRDALGKFVKKAIVHYRDDLDLQNLMDSIQKEVFPTASREHIWLLRRISHNRVHSMQNGNSETRKTAASVGFGAVCYFGPGERIFRSARSLMVPVRCGSPHSISHSHLHGLARLRTWVFPWEKPTLAGCTAGKSGGRVPVAKYKPVPCSLLPVQVLRVEQLHRLVVEPLL